jgi:hypothetical protein
MQFEQSKTSLAFEPGLVKGGGVVSGVVVPSVPASAGGIVVSVGLTLGRLLMPPNPLRGRFDFGNFWLGKVGLDHHTRVGLSDPTRHGVKVLSGGKLKPPVRGSQAFEAIKADPLPDFTSFPVPSRHFAGVHNDFVGCQAQQFSTNIFRIGGLDHLHDNFWSRGNDITRAPWSCSLLRNRTPSPNQTDGDNQTCNSTPHDPTPLANELSQDRTTISIAKFYKSHHKSHEFYFISD